VLLFPSGLGLGGGERRHVDNRVIRFAYEGAAVTVVVAIEMRYHVSCSMRCDLTVVQRRAGELLRGSLPVCIFPTCQLPIIVDNLTHTCKRFFLIFANISKKILVPK
jgi:hypothetical protein